MNDITTCYSTKITIFASKITKTCKDGKIYCGREPL